MRGQKRDGGLDRLVGYLSITLYLYDYKAKIWWPLLDLNQRPSDYESPALTTELRGRGGEL